jgi:hypothetical protein
MKPEKIKLSPACWALLYHFNGHESLDTFCCNNVPRTIFSIKTQVMNALEKRGFIERTSIVTPYLYQITELGRQTLEAAGLSELKEMERYLSSKKTKWKIDGHSRYR